MSTTPATPLHAAVFVPQGTPPDPPTGDVRRIDPDTEPAPPPTPAGPGLRWRLGPVDVAGRLAIDYQVKERRTVAFTDVDFSTYLHAPWFVQLRGGIGVVSSHDGSHGAHLSTASPGSSATSLTPRLGISVFPTSRFPFDFRAELGDSRTQSQFIEDQYRSLRVSLSQSYRPESGRESYALQVDHSRLQSQQWGTDSVSTVSAFANRTFDRHVLEASGTWTEAERTETDDTSSLRSLTARHGYQVANALRVDTLASWHQSDFALSGATFSSDLRQVSTLATWRPQEGDLLYVEDAPITLTGSARVLDGDFGSGDARRRSQQASASLGATMLPTRSVYLSAGVSGGFTQADDDARLRNALAHAGVTYTPDAVALEDDWRWAPSVSLAGNVGAASVQGRRTAVTTQLSHTLSRSVRLDSGSSASLSIYQSVGVLRESTTDTLARAVAHGVSASWQGVTGEASQANVSASFTDSRTIDSGRGMFELANVQVSQRTQLSRHSSLTGSLTAQASRSDVEQVDPFTGVIRTRSPGWQTFHHGSIAYDTQRVFGIPRLSFTLSAMVSSQQVERRIFGDIDAPREQISHGLEARFDYAIGRLQARAGVRHARIADGRANQVIFLRLQRNFRGF